MIFLKKSPIAPDDVLTHVCMQMHLNILLELHETTDVSQAFQHFSAWINEGVDELTFIKCLTKSVCALLGLPLANCYKLLFPALRRTPSRGVSFPIQVVHNS